MPGIIERVHPDWVDDGIEGPPVSVHDMNFAALLFRAGVASTSYVQFLLKTVNPSDSWTDLVAINGQIPSGMAGQVFYVQVMEALLEMFYRRVPTVDEAFVRTNLGIPFPS